MVAHNFVCPTCKRHFKYASTLFKHNDSTEHEMNVINRQLEDWLIYMRNKNINMSWRLQFDDMKNKVSEK